MTENPRTPRIGIAKLTKMAFDAVDLAPLWNRLVADVQRDPSNAPALMDLSCIAQLTGDPQTGASLQSRALVQEVLYRSPCAAKSPRLRLLAFAAPVDMGGNTPIEFLLEGSDVELQTLFIAPGLSLPNPLPDHDIAIVTVPDSTDTRPMLDAIEKLAPSWPRPILNLPQQIKGLDRDRLYQNLRDVSGVEIPATARVTRADLADIALSDVILLDVLDDGAFPLIVRPAGSHAGKGLVKLDTPGDIDTYLASQPENEFFVSRYVDYSDADGQFRKYRIVMIDGRSYACHMAVCAEWKVWYLNADMAENAAKREEEERFMLGFDREFGVRHAAALAGIAERIGLDYFSIDCAETRDGRLLVFEADNAAIVHNMDPPATFAYKPPQMRKVFAAFIAMLDKYSRAREARAA
jgi:hypothetical protein